MRFRKTNMEVENCLSGSVLTREQCALIYDKACQLLHEYGMKLEQDTCGTAKAVLRQAGCDIRGDMVHFPKEVIEKALESAPSEITMYDQLGNVAVVLRGDAKTAPAMSAPSPIFRWDVHTGQRRKATLQDDLDTAILCDQLENIDFVNGMGWISDCTEMLPGTYEARELIRGTNKPLTIWGVDRNDFETAAALCAEVAGGVEEFRRKPFALTYCGNFSNADVLLSMLDSGMPIFAISNANQLGITAPNAVAATLVKGLAENLAVIVLAQNYRKGSPIIGSISIADTDFSSVGYLMSSPRFQIACGAVCDLFHYLNLPAQVGVAGTNAPVVDAQCISDTALQLMTSKLSGNLMTCGFLDSCMAGSLELLLYSNDLLSYLNNLVQGVQIDEDTMALELMMECGLGGSYITEEHTMEHLDDTWSSQTFYNLGYDKWKAAGEVDYLARANERVRKILEAGIRAPKSEELMSRLDRIIEQAEARLN